MVVLISADMQIITFLHFLNRHLNELALFGFRFSDLKHNMFLGPLINLFTLTVVYNVLKLSKISIL